jgi:hypothetical protein
MFVKFSTVLAAHGLHPNDCFNFHSRQLVALQEAAWEGGRRWGSELSPIVATPGFGTLQPQAPSSTSVAVAEPLRGLMRTLDRGIVSDNGARDLGDDTFLLAAETLLTDLRQNAALGRFWPHIVYAYLVENTGVERICRRLLELALHGESLGGISEAGQRWLRNTEDLFYRDGDSSLVPSITSWLRPDPRASRRNAYRRMLGVELNHGVDGDLPFPGDKPQPGDSAEVSNADFIATFEEFLREVWAAYTNATNTSGPKTTDKAAIAELAARMSLMLNDRRQHGALTREEYAGVCAMSWFHLSVSSNAPIVVDLKAEATSPEGRLRKLGERVGVPAHGKARSLFMLAERVSTLLIEIEQERYSDAASVDVLFDPKVGPDTSSDMLTIINHWRTATGRDLKASSVTVTGR